MFERFLCVLAYGVFCVGVVVVVVVVVLGVFFARTVAVRRGNLKIKKAGGGLGRGLGGVFLLEVQYSILKSLISTCVLSYVGSREDWLLDRICES